MKYILGIKAKSLVYGIEGIVTARSKNLYGCNRYFIQPPADKQGKMGDGNWFDEDDLKVTGKGLSESYTKKTTGGPASKIK